MYTLLVLRGLHGHVNMKHVHERVHERVHECAHERVHTPYFGCSPGKWHGKRLACPGVASVLRVVGLRDRLRDREDI